MFLSDGWKKKNDGAYIMIKYHGSIVISLMIFTAI